ncbi:MAG: biotin--[acetyl-CoA-carboxylase] ligase [Opitutales bacterium]|nr:biotin--[acetyl-CoA-carboxylase] ligase [Opitutales bacterium]
MNPTDIHLLRAFLAAGDAFVSGSVLAEEVGLTRVAIWARLEKLRENGFVFEAVRNRGYRLLKTPSHLDGRLVAAHLALTGAERTLHFHPSIDSTNSEAERLLATSGTAPFVVAAAGQTKGRGRLGRVWHSPAEGNLYASFAFRPRIAHRRIATITLWMGAGLCDYLERAWGVPVQVKWPNDLLIQGRKVAGILTEARIDADLTRELVIGIGLNIQGNTAAWPAEASRVATTLTEHASAPLPVNAVAAGFIETVFQLYEAFIAETHREAFPMLWKKYDALAGKTIRASMNGRELSGEAAGIDGDGALLLQATDGQTHRLHSGEVTIGSGR